MPRNGNTTRDQILGTAMRKFVEQGYDKTSLREIAEEVGVTKAALYYHFRTKDDIVRTAMDEFVDTVNEILDRFETQPPGEERNAALADAIMELLGDAGALPFQFGQANPTVMARESFGTRDKEYVRRFMSLAAGPDASADAVLRSTLAFGALVMSSMPQSPLPTTASPDERRAAGRALALELLAPLS